MEERAGRYLCDWSGGGGGSEEKRRPPATPGVRGAGGGGGGSGIARRSRRWRIGGGLRLALGLWRAGRLGRVAGARRPASGVGSAMGTRRLSAKPMGGRGPWVDEAAVGWLVDEPSLSEPITSSRACTRARAWLAWAGPASTMRPPSVEKKGRVPGGGRS